MIFSYPEMFVCFFDEQRNRGNQPTNQRPALSGSPLRDWNLFGRDLEARDTVDINKTRIEKKKILVESI